MQTRAEKMLRLRQIAIEFLTLGRSEDRELIEWVLAEIQWLSAGETRQLLDTVSPDTIPADTIPVDGEKTDNRGSLFGFMKSDVEAKGYGLATIFTGQNGQCTNFLREVDTESIRVVTNVKLVDGQLEVSYETIDFRR